MRTKCYNVALFYMSKWQLPGALTYTVLQQVKMCTNEHECSFIFRCAFFFFFFNFEFEESRVLHSILYVKPYRN
jgi:hypothetical protein